MKDNHESLEAAGRIRRLWKLSAPCRLCPRTCGVDRSESTGFCGVYGRPVISSAGPHFGEESCLVGKGGSGTVFFAGCNLKCVFCQNHEISHYAAGQEVSVGQLAALMLELQNAGCHNINLVTPTHFAAPTAEAVRVAKNGGLDVPVVYNTGGYDSPETLKLLEGLVDIYMPDMKFSGPETAERFLDAKDYPRINFEAVKEMHRQVGDLRIINGLAVRGLLVRHLVLPGGLSGWREIFDFLGGEISRDTAVNVMDQYRPCFLASEYPDIDHRPDFEEVEAAVRYAREKGFRLMD